MKLFNILKKKLRHFSGFAFAVLFICCVTGRPPVYIENSGSSVVFRAQSNRTTGFTWQIRMEGPGLFEIEYERFANDDGKIMGAPSSDEYTLGCVKPGAVKVFLLYSRPWEGGDRLVEYMYEFEISNDLLATLLNSERIIFDGVDEESLPFISGPIFK